MAWRQPSICCDRKFLLRNIEEALSMAAKNPPKTYTFRATAFTFLGK
jgi:hypothetical protein